MSQSIEITYSNFQTEVVESDVPVLLDMWAAWCGPCRMVGPSSTSSPATTPAASRSGSSTSTPSPSSPPPSACPVIPTLRPAEGRSGRRACGRRAAQGTARSGPSPGRVRARRRVGHDPSETGRHVSPAVMGGRPRRAPIMLLVRGPSPAAGIGPLFSLPARSAGVTVPAAPSRRCRRCQAVRIPARSYRRLASVGLSESTARPTRRSPRAQKSPKAPSSSARPSPRRRHVARTPGRSQTPSRTVPASRARRRTPRRRRGRPATGRDRSADPRACAPSTPERLRGVHPLLANTSSTQAWTAACSTPGGTAPPPPRPASSGRRRAVQVDAHAQEAAADR